MGAPFNVMNEASQLLLANFDAAGNLQILGNVVVGSTTPLASGGVGVVELANASVLPTNVTPGGVALYASGGVLGYKNAAGLVNTVTGSQGAATAAGTPVANSSAETVLQSLTIPAGDVVAGAVYHSLAFGIYSWTLTPTIQFTNRWGGLGGTAIAQQPTTTLGTAQSNAHWAVETWLTFYSPTSAIGLLRIALNTSSVSDASNVTTSCRTSAVAVTSNTANAWVTTVAWGTANAANTLTMLGGFTERIA